MWRGARHAVKDMTGDTYKQNICIMSIRKRPEMPADVRSMEKVTVEVLAVLLATEKRLALVRAFVDAYLEAEMGH
jgi:hypothetical protein